MPLESHQAGAGRAGNHTELVFITVIGDLDTKRLVTQYDTLLRSWDSSVQLMRNGIQIPVVFYLLDMEDVLGSRSESH